MVALLSRRPQAAPSGAVAIDWGHPLAAGLQAYFAFSTGSRQSLTGRGRLDGSPGWRAGGFDVSSGTRSYPFSADTWRPAAAPFTVAVTGFQPSASGLLETVMSLGGTGFCSWYAAVNGTSAGLQFTKRAVADIASTLKVRDNQYATSFGVDPTSRVMFGCNGAVEDSANTSAFAEYSETAYYGLGSCFGIGAPSCLYAVGIWSRSLTPGEHSWITTEPYAFLTQGVHRRIFLMSGGATVTFRPQILIA